MYHPSVITKSIARVEQAEGIRLISNPIGRVDDICHALAPAWNPDKAVFTRRLLQAEQEFIRNELLMSMCDFAYWANRYCSIKLSGGGLGRLSLWESQRIVLSHIARIEAEVQTAYAAGDPVDGIRIIQHKSRQLGATALARALTMHRAIFSRHFNAMAASIDDDKVFELYSRDKAIYDNLPWWMKPSIEFDEKAEHISFGKIDTMILYQQSRQKSGLGQGRQFVVSHLTECAFWDYPQMIALDYAPTMPQSPNTLAILESTANGRGNWWHEYTEETRIGDHPEWHYVFVPWYAERTKYRRKPPEGWTPSQHSQLHARKVHETSHEWVGRTVDLPTDQLYWYETARASAQKAGELNLFLTNYCSTPDESFQHTTSSAFSSELLDKLRLETTVPPLAYEVAVR